MSYRPFPSFAEWADLEINISVYDRYADLLRATKDAASPEALAAAVNRATKFAAIDTGAIEGLYEVDRGFTRTVATEAAAWEALATTRGEYVKNAIYDALEAYEIVLDLATRKERLTEVAIRGLHDVICKSQETYLVYTAAGKQEHPLPRGQYKRFPNNPTSVRTGRVHEYAPVADTASEMHRLVKELSSAPFEAAHPVLQAAYAHYAFVCIHPFADGNGRVSRALASAYLYRAPGVPLLIFADQKDAYIDALEAADAGDQSQFVGFVLERVIDVVQLIRTFLRASPSLSSTVAQIREVHASRGALTHAEMEAFRARLADAVTAEIGKQFGSLDLGGLQWSIVVRSGSDPDLSPPAGYQVLPRDGFGMQLFLTAGPPTEIQASRIVGAFVAVPGTTGPDLIVADSRSDDFLEVFVREINPMVTHVLELKISAWVEALIENLAAQVLGLARVRLKELGYIE